MFHTLLCKISLSTHLDVQRTDDFENPTRVFLCGIVV